MTEIAIAGGGASGVLLATQILRKTHTTRVTVFEPGELGRGLAYGTSCPMHLLNVPAGKMSAFPDEPAHFVDWLAARFPGRYAGSSFVPRSVYGEYLHDIAQNTARAHPGRFTHVKSELADPPAHGSALVLATGNPAPAPPAAASACARFFSSAWTSGALMPERRGDAILILGTGLTAIDAAFGLRYNGHPGVIYLISRHGLLPHEHRPYANGEWRTMVDGLRPISNALWRDLPRAERQRFFRHAAPYWNVHRHRLAPDAAVTLAQLLAAGSVRTIAGRALSFSETPDGLSVRLRERGRGEERTIDVQRAINCSGPNYDVRRHANPLFRRLLESGELTPAAGGIGAEIAANGALIDAAGLPSRRLFAIGPVRFGSLIETTAIPEIRVQAAELAATLQRIETAV